VVKWKIQCLEKGLCLGCGAKPHRPNRRTCADCSAADWKQKKVLKAERKKRGDCTSCGRKSRFGKNICYKCHFSRVINALDILPEERVRARKAVALFNKRCQCCGADNPGKKGEWCIDHCHKTKRFRGIICNGCNCTLGFAQDRRERLLAAVEYLDRSIFKDCVKLLMHQVAEEKKLRAEWIQKEVDRTPILITDRDVEAKISELKEVAEKNLTQIKNGGSI